MTRTLRNCAARIVLLLGLHMAGTALAQNNPATIAAQPGYLPFVDASGVVSQNLRRSVVVKTLGPPQGDVKVLLLHYPQLGLSFALPSEGAQNEHWGSDPPVLWMQVTPPSRAQTLGGLQIGQPQALAVEILTRDYKVTTKVMGPGPGPGTNVVAMRATDRDQRTKRELEVRFEGGAVSGLSFFTHDPAKARDRTRRTLSELPPRLAIIAVAAGLSALVATFMANRAGARRRWRLPGHIAGPLGAALLVAGLVAFWMNLSGLREGDPYGRMVNLVGLIFGFGFGFLGLGVMAQSDSRLFAWPARAALALLIVALLLDQAGWFWS
jgi:hypothetical protein